MTCHQEPLEWLRGWTDKKVPSFDFVICSSLACLCAQSLQSWLFAVPLCLTQFGWISFVCLTNRVLSYEVPLQMSSCLSAVFCCGCQHFGHNLYILSPTPLLTGLHVPVKWEFRCCWQKIVLLNFNNSKQRQLKALISVAATQAISWFPEHTKLVFTSATCRSPACNTIPLPLQIAYPLLLFTTFFICYFLRESFSD